MFAIVLLLLLLGGIARENIVDVFLQYTVSSLSYLQREDIVKSIVCCIIAFSYVRKSYILILYNLSQQQISILFLSILKNLSNYINLLKKLARTTLMVLRLSLLVANTKLLFSIVI